MNKLVRQAFTLIELLVVIAIIGILSGLIVISMGGMTQKATIAKNQVFSNSLRDSLMLNLVSEYKFDGDSIDYWGNNDNGVLSGPIYKSSSECVSEQCLSFDGIDDYIQINHDFVGGLSALTAEIWVNGQQQSNIICATNGIIILHFRGAGFYLIGGDGTVSGYLSWDSALPYDSWTHIAATWDGSIMSLFINGKKQTSTRSFAGGSTNKLQVSSYIQVGNFFNTGQPYFKGLIDNFRFYNKAISTSQIQEQYYLGLNSLLANGNIDTKEYSERINSIAQQ